MECATVRPVFATCSGNGVRRHGAVPQFPAEAESAWSGMYSRVCDRLCTVAEEHGQSALVVKQLPAHTAVKVDIRIFNLHTIHLFNKVAGGSNRIST